ncbi:MAG: hypothetical protein RLZ16_220 [Bacteroidota bacterium]
MWAICKKEWTHYFSGLTGYLIIGFYLVVNGLFLFVLPNYNILDFGYASLQVYFDIAPWFLLVLIPAITMRSFSDEYKQGTYEILKSLPVSPLSLVTAKFLGAIFIVLTALLPTIFYAVAIDALSSVGGLDWGATLGAYMGLVLLAATYTAIGIFSSTITKNSLIALLVSIVLSLLIYKGFDLLSTITVFKNGMDFYVSQLGLSAHYASVSKGVLELRDIIYFGSIIILFGLGSLEKIAGKIKFVFVLVILIALNYGSVIVPLQLDLTKEHRYTLSNSSKEIIKQLQAPVKIHVYLAGDLPPYYKKIAASTEGLLSKLYKINPANIEWSFEVPSEMYKDTALYQFYDSLSKLGLPIERLQDQNTQTDKRVDQLLIPGALVEVQGQVPFPIDLRSSKKYFKPYNIVKDIPMEDLEASANAAEALLEYKFTQAIYLLNRTKVPTIAYAIGNGQPIDLTVNDIGETLKNQYDLTVFDLKKGYPDAKKIKTLLIVKPTLPFTDLDKLKLDQYVMNGGNIIWAIDKLHAEYDSLQKTSGSYIAFDRGLGLDDMLFKYGVRINTNLVQDLNCAKLPLVVGVQPDRSPLIQRMPWPYYPFLNGNEAHPITQNMDRILSMFPSSIDTIANPAIRKTILLTTDTNSRLIATPTLVTLNSVKDEADMYSFNKHKVTIAALLEGKFSSLYANRVSQANKDSIFNLTGVPFQAKALAASKQIVLSDADIITNKIARNEDGSPNPLPMGMIPYEEYQFGNKTFFLNAIEYINEPAGLLESRSKQVVLRLLNKDKVEENRLFWQIILLMGPIAILSLIFVVWTKYRSTQFAD